MKLADAMPALAARRRALAAAWRGELLDLIQAPRLETSDGERALDALVARLRRAWMSIAHECADASFRSLPGGEHKVLPSRASISYAYERSLTHTPFDARLPVYHPVPEGWTA